MSDLISRQAAIDDLREYKVGPSHFCDESEIECFNDGIDTAISVLATLPSAERQGRWMFNIDDKGWSWDKPYMCDQCGEWAEKEFKFCPSCRAKMEGAEE